MKLQFPELTGKPVRFDWACALLVRHKTEPERAAIAFKTPGEVGMNARITFLSCDNPTFANRDWVERNYEVLRVIPFTDLIISAVQL